METTTTTPTGVSTWISLGQHRPGSEGGPLEGDDVRLRCPEGHGKALARELREYDPAPDARKLAEVEPLPQEDLEWWVRVLHLSGLLAPEEVDTLLRPLPGRDEARNDSPRVQATLGLNVIQVLADRLGGTGYELGTQFGTHPLPGGPAGGRA